MSTKIKYSNKRKTTDQYIQELDKLNPTIECCEEYINARTPILHKCKICAHEWKASPGHVLNGTGCPPCNYKRGWKKNTISHEQFIKNVADRINPYVEIVGRYANAHTKLECKCLLCGKTLWITPGNLYNGRGCASCMNRLNNPNKTHEQFIKELFSVNPSIKILSDYVGAREYIKCQCLKCGYQWNAIPTNLLREHGCPKCLIYSKGEDSIRKVLESYRIEYNAHKNFSDLIGLNGGLLSYDFYLPSYNLLIEFQGAQHEYSVEYFGGEKQFEQQIEHDRRKREYAKQHGIKLLEIWYYDYDKIEEILKNNLNLETVETDIGA